MVSAHSFTWSSLGRGLVGAALGSVVETSGILGSTLIRCWGATGSALKSLYRTEKFGPVLKTTLAPAVTLGGITSPVVCGLAAMLHGLVDGFITGATKGVSAVPRSARAHVRRFHVELVDEAVESLTEWAAQKPEKIYEIKVIEGLKGLVSGVYGGVIYGAGVLACALVNVWGIYGKLTRMLWEGRVQLPFMVGGQIILTAATPIMVLLLGVAGLIGGVGVNAFRGYKAGLWSAFTGAPREMWKIHRDVFKTAYRSDD